MNDWWFKLAAARSLTKKCMWKEIKFSTSVHARKCNQPQSQQVMVMSNVTTPEHIAKGY